MNLVVTTSEHDYAGFHCTSTLRGIDWATVDALIYNVSVDSVVDVSMALAAVPGRVSKVIYIANPFNPVLHSLFSGMNADLYDDVSLLDDEDTLSFLVEEFGNTGMTVKGISEDVSRISEFVGAVEAGNTFDNPVYLKTLQTSLDNMSTSLALVDQTNAGMLQVFGKTSAILDNLESQRRKMDGEIDQLRRNLNLAKTMAAGATHGGITMYPEYRLPAQVLNCIHVKAYSPCMYLGSFLYYYHLYLRERVGRPTRLLIITGKAQMVQKRYEKIPTLRADQVPTPDMLKSSVFVTSDPQQSVLNTFFGMPATVYIVLDISYGAPILTGPRVIQLAAVSSIGDISRFGLKSQNCFLPIAGVSNSLNIKRIKSFGYMTKGDEIVATTERERARNYFEVFHDSLYRKLDSLLGIVTS